MPIDHFNERFTNSKYLLIYKRMAVYTTGNKRPSTAPDIAPAIAEAIPPPSTISNSSVESAVKPFKAFTSVFFRLPLLLLYFFSKTLLLPFHTRQFVSFHSLCNPMLIRDYKLVNMFLNNFYVFIMND